MTAYADETVNICVERDYSLLSAETTLKVYTFNEEEIMAQSLLFAGGVKEVCFDFTVPEQPFEEEYYFTIGGDSEPLKLYVEEGILYGTCGTLPLHQAQGHDPAVFMYDRFGNTYDSDPEMSRFFELSTLQADAGYFDIRFNAAELTLSEAELDIISLVFHDISDLINRRNPATVCGDRTELGIPIIDLSSDFPEGSSVLGAASPLYIEAPNCYGVIESRIFTKINGGQIFTNTADALLNINPNFNWHTDATTDPIDNAFDLYTVVWHEALHILGFASTLSYVEIFNAIPMPTPQEMPFVFATRWDHIMHTTSDYLLPESTSAPVLNREITPYCRALETAIFTSGDDFLTAVETNCEDTNLILTAGQSGNIPIAGPETNPITGIRPLLTNQSSLLNALSHLNGNCNGILGDSDDVPYLMLPSLRAEETREIQEAEIALLCELGYSVDNCEGCFILPYLDGVNVNTANFDFYSSCCAFDNVFCIGQTETISFDLLLCNDRIDASEEFDIEDFNINSGASSLADFMIDFDSRTIAITGHNLGQNSIAYSINGCNGLSIRSRFHFVIEPCIDCSEAVPCDNLVCTNDFDFEEASSITPWFFGDFWQFEIGGNSPDICNVTTENGILQMGTHFNNPEGFALDLLEPVLPGCELSLRFDAFGASSSQTPHLFEILGSSTRPCNAWDTRVNFGCEEPTDCEGYVYAPICIRIEPIAIGIQSSNVTCPDDFPFSPYEIIWTNTTDEPIFVLILSSTATNENGAIYLDNLSVTQNCTNAAFNFETSCLDATFTPEVTADNLTHEWNFGDPTSTENTSDLANPSHTYTGEGTYEVTHTVTDECGNVSIATNELAVILDEDCFEEGLVCLCNTQSPINIVADDVNGTSFTDTQLGLLMTNNGAGNNLDLTNRCVTISGKLLIDNVIADAAQLDLVIFGGRIMMQPGAEIVITNGARVQFRGQPNVDASIFEGCEQMWRGIHVEENAVFTLIDFKVEDAQHAVSVEKNAGIWLARNQFRRNFIGLYHFGEPFQLSSFAGNTFDGSELLLPPFDATLTSPVTIQSRSYAGVYLASMGVGQLLGFGNEFSTPNTFSNLPLGISIVGNVDVSMVNNQFQNIHQYGDVAYPFEGYGVYLYGFSGNSMINHDGRLYNTTSLLAYDNCTIGIYVEQADVAIYHTQMNCNRKGIEVINSNAGIHISSNTLELPANGTGISLLHNDGASHIEVDANNITLWSPEQFQNRGAGFGIRMEESGNRPAGRSATIERNVISLTTGYDQSWAQHLFSAGIYLNAVNNTSIGYDANYISCGTARDVGIWIQGSYDCHISENWVSGIEGQNTPLGIGLKTENTTSTSYGCNNFSNLVTGVEFVAGNSYDSYFTQNQFHPPFENGLVYRDMLSINEQIHHENKWYGTMGDYVGKAALNESSNPGTFSQQRFVTHSSNPISHFWPPSIEPDGGQQTWFNVLASDEYLKPCDLEYLKPEGDQLSRLDERIIEGLSLSGNFIDSRLWATERAAFDKYRFMDNSNTASSPFAGLATVLLNHFNNFEQNAENGQVGYYQAVQDEVNSIYFSDSQNEWDDLWKYKRIALQEWFLLHQSLNNDSPSSDWGNYEGLQTSLDEYNTSLNQIWESKYATIQAKAETAKIANEGLSIDITPQENEKIMNAMLANTVLQGITTFSEAEKEEIKSVADQCPLSGGKAVHTARSLYALIDPDYEFLEDCAPIQALQTSFNSNETIPSLDIKDKKKALTESWKLYPNPANDQLFVTYKLTTDSHIKLFNSYGELLLSRSLSADRNSLTINSSSFPSGLYFIQMYDVESKTNSSQKIIITH